MNAVLYAPFNMPRTIRIADRVEAGPGVPVLMMLHEMRQAIEAGKDVSCTQSRELQPKLAARIYNKFRQMRPYDGLLERVRVRTEMDAPIVRAARDVLEVSGNLRTYANKFILSSACKRQLKESGYDAIYPDLFRSYALDFNWAYWPSFYEYDPFQDVFCFTLFQLARRGDAFVSPADYASGFYGAFPMRALDLVGDDDSVEALDYLITIYVIHVVVQLWGFFGLVEFSDKDPGSDEMAFVRSTPLFRELIQFPAGWLADK